jgi:hypothetical protein
MWGWICDMNIFKVIYRFIFKELAIFDDARSESLMIKSYKIHPKMSGYLYQSKVTNKTFALLNIGSYSYIGINKNYIAQLLEFLNDQNNGRFKLLYHNEEKYFKLYTLFLLNRKTIERTFFQKEIRSKNEGISIIPYEIENGYFLNKELTILFKQMLIDMNAHL